MTRFWICTCHVEPTALGLDSISVKRRADNQLFGCNSCWFLSSEVCIPHFFHFYIVVVFDMSFFLYDIDKLPVKGMLQNAWYTWHSFRLIFILKVLLRSIKRQCHYYILGSIMDKMRSLWTGNYQGFWKNCCKVRISLEGVGGNNVILISAWRTSSRSSE